MTIYCPFCGKKLVLDRHGHGTCCHCEIDLELCQLDEQDIDYAIYVSSTEEDQ